MTDEQNPNEWLPIERLLSEHNITAIESIAVGGSLQVYDEFNSRILANDHDASDYLSLAFALNLINERKNRLDKERPYFLYYSEYDEWDSLHSPLNGFGWTRSNLPTLPPRWLTLIRYLGEGTAKLAKSIKDGSLQIYSFNGLTLHANDNDYSDVNSKAFVLKILADRQGRINYPEPEYEHLHNYCTEDEIHSLQRFGWYEDSLPQFQLINPHFSLLNEVTLGVIKTSLEDGNEVHDKPDANITEWSTGESKQNNVILPKKQFKNPQKAPKKSKLKQQQDAILEVISIKQFDPMEIPDGEKGTIKDICKTDYDELFKAENSFDRAWKNGIRTLWKMKHYDSYAHRGNA